MPRKSLEGPHSGVRRNVGAPRSYSHLDSFRSLPLRPNIAVLELRLAGLTYGQSLSAIVHDALLFTAADGAAIAVASDGQIKCRARAGALAPPIDSTVPMDSGISGVCMRSGEVINCTDTESDPRVDAEACRYAGIRSVLAVPITSVDKPCGVFAVFSTSANAFGEREMENMLLLSGLIPSPAKSASADESPTLQDVTEPSAEKLVRVVETEPIKGYAASRRRALSTSRQIAGHLETIRQDAGLQLLGRVKSYLIIESLYDATERAEAIHICEKLMLGRAEEIGVVLPSL